MIENRTYVKTVPYPAGREHPMSEAAALARSVVTLEDGERHARGVEGRNLFAPVFQSLFGIDRQTWHS